MATEPIPTSAGETQNYSSIIEPPTQHPSPPITGVPSPIVEATEKGMMGENLLNHQYNSPTTTTSNTTASSGSASTSTLNSPSLTPTPTPGGTGGQRHLHGERKGEAGYVLPGTTPSRAEDALLVGRERERQRGNGDVGGGRDESLSMRGVDEKGNKRIRWKGLDA